MQIKIKKVHPDAKVPEYKTAGAAACDVTCVEEVVINPKESVFVRTGLSFEFPEELVLILAPRSSFCLKNNLDIPNSIAIGDADYRGEYLLPVRNLGDTTITIPKGERIAQILFLQRVKAIFEEVDDLSNTERGNGGFGSTGKF